MPAILNYSTAQEEDVDSCFFQTAFAAWPVLLCRKQFPQCLEPGKMKPAIETSRRLSSQMDITAVRDFRVTGEFVGMLYA